MEWKWKLRWKQPCHAYDDGAGSRGTCLLTMLHLIRTGQHMDLGT